MDFERNERIVAIAAVIIVGSELDVATFRMAVDAELHGAVTVRGLYYQAEVAGVPGIDKTDTPLLLGLTVESQAVAEFLPNERTFGPASCDGGFIDTASAFGSMYEGEGSEQVIPLSRAAPVLIFSLQPLV